MRISYLLALVTTFASFAATAHAEGIEIPCEGSPTTAVLEVPAPANRFVHVLCTKYGHVLAPIAGWFWTPPGTYSPVFLPAQMVHDNPKETGNAVNFTAIIATPLEGTSAADRWKLLGEVFPKDTPPTKALEIVAISSGGEKHRIYIFTNSWGYSCSPVCTKDAAFILISERKEAPQW